ncbi:SDR family NAD(P)-dependent oxidoreductase [Roseomonas sp. KE2513]|uniref:SDR family NAD(P)-dependent oxidoreductase n=1 Tax=Roseomonas sp. KE2513 TaxID=2479202 RepID=UPI0018DFF698|nr:SDR family oxidoreductase [Roseomonas sp. KE2513]
MTGRLAGKVALVLGAGTEGGGLGNGKAAALAYSEAGAVLHLLDRDARALDETAAEIPGCTTSLADATDPAALRDAVAACEAAHGGLDILHNNIGVAIAGAAESVSAEDFERGFRLNVTTALLAIQAAIPAFRRRGGGAIVNIASLSGVRVMEGLSYVAYPVAKAALSQLTRVVAANHGPDNIRCNAILPGFIQTPMVERAVLRAAGGMSLDAYLAKRSAAIPLGRWGEARDVAMAAVFLASDEARYVTGVELLIDGGASLLTG